MNEVEHVLNASNLKVQVVFNGLVSTERILI